MNAPSLRSANLRAWALGGMLALYFLAFFQRAGVPGTIFDELQREFQLSASAVTGLGAIFLYVYAGMQLVAGVAADRFGGRRTLLFGGLFLALGAVLFPLTHSVAGLYASRVLIAFGSGFVYLSIVKEVDLLYPAERFAGLMGLVLTVSYGGAIAATLPFERAVHAVGWRPSLVAVGLLTMGAVLVAAVVLGRLDQVASQHTGIPLRLIGDVLRNKRSWPLLAIGLINFPVMFVIQSTLGKKFLQDVAGISSAGAATFVLVMACACGAAAMAGGPVLRWTGQRRKPWLVLAAGLLLLAALLLLVGVMLRAPGWVFLLGYVLLALSTVASPATTATMKELNRPDAVAVAISLLNGLCYAGVGVLANVAGAILDAFRAGARVTAAGIVYPTAAYATLFAVLAGLAVVSLGVAVFLVPETHGRPVTLEEIEREWA